MAYTQENRLIAIDTPLGDNVLLLQGLRGDEGISRLFNFQLEFLSENHPEIAFNKIVGQRVTIRVALDRERERYFNGFISRFSQGGSDARFTHYQAEMVPWLWFLTRTADCRIFQNMKVPDIIEKIFTDLGFQDYSLRLEGSYEPREYCVQYRETDFNFVSRLMEEYGIFYFFEHEEDKHTLVLGDTPKVHKPCPKQETARCEFTPGSSEGEDVITSWEMEQQYIPGKYSLTDYNFETPSTSLVVSVDSTVQVSGNGKYEVYDFPGDYLKKPEGESLVRLRMEEEEAQHFTVNGGSACRAFTSGYRFNLEEHYRRDVNKSYVLTEVIHVASVGESYTGEGSGAGESYSNQFTCVPHSVPFRPRRVTPQPFVQGPQTALVVGKSGEEIWTDKYGRVKVQFYWDREGKKNENSSCWVRVSHPWAGKGWGAISIPRIGQEVLVDFLHGDPNLPVVSGRIYNAEVMPPYGLPGGQVVSGIKSNSTKGGGGYNEISMDDSKGTEKITIHGQYDMGTVVEHDQTSTIHNNRTDKIDVDDSETVGANQSLSVGKNRTRTIGVDDSETVGANQTLAVVRNRIRTVGLTETVTVGGARTHSVGGAETITVGGAQAITIGGLQALTVGATRAVTVGASQTVKIGTSLSENIGTNHQETVGDNRTASIGKDDSVKVGKNLLIDAGDQITIKTGKASITMKKDGTIMIQGKDISTKGKGEIYVKASKDITMKGKKILEN